MRKEAREVPLEVARGIGFTPCHDGGGGGEGGGGGRVHLVLWFLK